MRIHWLKCLLVAFVGFQLLSACEPADRANEIPGTNTAEPEESAYTEMGLEKYKPTIEISFVRATGAGLTDLLGALPGETLENNRWSRLYERELGIKIKYDWTAKGELYHQKLGVAIASGSLPDVVRVNAHQLRQLTNAGLIQDLSDVYKQYATPLTKEILGQEGTGPFEAATIDGKLMGIPETNSSIERAQYLWIRTDWLETLGLQPPKTMDELLAVSKAFTEQDPDRNGEQDTYGLAVTHFLWDFVMGIDGFMAGFNAFPNRRGQDAPFPFDRRYQAKYAYWGMVEAVKTLIPPKLPIVVKNGTAAQGTPVPGGAADLAWQTIGALSTERSGTLQAQFKTLWDASNLYVRVEVKDATNLPGDQVELFVLDNNEIKPYRIPRTDASVIEASGGYIVEAAIPVSGTSEPGRQVKFDVRVTDTLVNDGSEHGGNGTIVSWSDPSNMQHAYSEGYGILTYIAGSKTAQALYGTPQIDGERDSIWEIAEELDTNVWVEGSGGATAKLRTLWDEQYLYVYAVVSDNLLSDQSPNVWEQDSIEIFVDQNNGKTQSYQADDGQYRINFNNVRSFGGRANGDNYQSEVKLIDGGYIVEAAILLDMIAPQEGTVIGFDLQVNDDANGDGRRNSVAIWNDPTGQSYQNTSRLGVLQFAKLSEPPKLAKPEFVEASALNRQVVELKWTKADGAIGYHVYQAASPAGPFVKLTAEPVRSTMHVMNKLQPNTTYYYAVTAVYSDGESEFTAPVSAITNRK